MQIDLTPEEVSLISEVLNKAELAMNRQSMSNYVNLTNAIFMKFHVASLPPVEEPSEETEACQP